MNCLPLKQKRKKKTKKTKERKTMTNATNSNCNWIDRFIQDASVVQNKESKLIDHSEKYVWYKIDDYKEKVFENSLKSNFQIPYAFQIFILRQIRTSFNYSLFNNKIKWIKEMHTFWPHSCVVANILLLLLFFAFRFNQWKKTCQNNRESYIPNTI